MGRKFTIHRSLRGTHALSAQIAAQTKFSDADLKLFWEAVKNMFEHDRSAVHGLMSTRLRV